MTDKEMRPRITVLGATGLLGTALTRCLARQQICLRLVARRPAVVSPIGLVADIEYRAIDLTVAGAVADAVSGSDAVIHLVAHSSDDGSWRVKPGDKRAERVNVGLVHDLVCAAESGWTVSAPLTILYASSVSLSALDEMGSAEIDDVATTFDTQKARAEHAITAAMATGHVRGAILRLSTLYSQGGDDPDRDRGVVATMMRRALAGTPLTLWHDGSTTRDLLCVDDAAQALVAALTSVDNVGGHTWTIGSGISTKMADLFSSIVAVASHHTHQPPSDIVYVPAPGNSIPTDRLDFVPDSTAFRQATGWASQVDLSDGLLRLAQRLSSRSQLSATSAENG